MLRAARAAGFSIVAFSDDPDKGAQEGADLLLEIEENDEAGVDLYLTRVLMVFEMALARMSGGL